MHFTVWENLLLHLTLHTLPMLVVAIAWLIVFARTQRATALLLAMLSGIAICLQLASNFIMIRGDVQHNMSLIQGMGYFSVAIQWISAFALLVYAFGCRKQDRAAEEAYYSYQPTPEGPEAS